MTAIVHHFSYPKIIEATDSRRLLDSCIIWTVKPTNPDGVLQLSAHGESHKAILYFRTPCQGHMRNGMQTAIIAEGLPPLSRSKLHC